MINYLAGWLATYVFIVFFLNLSTYKMLVLRSDLFRWQRRKDEGWDGDGVTLVWTLAGLWLTSPSYPLLCELPP